MAKQEDLDRAYMTCAYAVSKLSHATRRKVGAIMVAPGGGIIAEGVNGMPAGFDNNPEEEKFDPMGIDAPMNQYKPLLVTKPECLHAESNAITKVARSTNSSVGATLYCTLTPCFHCAKLIIQAGVARVVYSELYPIDSNSGQTVGLKLLEEAGIQVDVLDLTCHHVVDKELSLEDEGRLHDDEDRYRA